MMQYNDSGDCRVSSEDYKHMYKENMQCCCIPLTLGEMYHESLELQVKYQTKLLTD